MIFLNYFFSAFHLQPYNDNSSYSSDSFTKYTSNPANRHDDSKLREKMGEVNPRLGGLRSNDPYRFTRSTANKVSTSNIDKSKLSDLSAKYRYVLFAPFWAIIKITFVCCHTTDSPDLHKMSPTKKKYGRF